MRIASTNLFLRSEHAAETKRRTSETLRAWTGPTRPDFEGSRAAADGRPPPPAALARISEAARALAAASAAPAPAPPAPTTSAQAVEDANNEIENDPILRLIKALIEILTGRPVKVFSARQLSRDIEVHSAETGRAATATADPNRRVGWGVEYDAHTVTEETERTHVSAAGTVRTVDGHEIAFAVDLTLQRYHREETSVSIRAGDALRKDPLVINFGGSAVQLADQKFAFDLAGDGGSALLPLFASGSGYLALDINQNGSIDSGRELFGPTTDSGFGELARLDADGNGWLDESDAAYAKLRVWTPAATGNGTLVTLKDAGVGAISVAHVASPFELRGSGNADLGAVRASGVWLADSGKAGSVQEIDLTI